MPNFMITTRDADDETASGSARYLTFDETTGDETDFGDQPDQWLAELIGTFPSDISPVSGRPVLVGDIVLLVHGFNVSHAAACAFHVKCAQGLARAGWFGQLVSYDWPSDGLVFAYLPDRANARAAASTLVTSAIGLLERTQTAGCRIAVHVLAHSMACFVVQQAVTWAYQDVPAGWKVGQLIMVAADVDTTVFATGQDSAGKFDQHAARLTAYCNSYDKALAVSGAKRLDLAPRMGRVGLPDDTPAMMCEVDCSAYFDAHYPDLADQLNPVTTHSFYFAQDRFWQDVVLTLAGGIDRSVFPTRDPAGASDRFILQPGMLDLARYRIALTRAASSPSVQVPTD
jgi:hypothetical protein